MERLKRTYGWAGLLCFLICGAAYVQAGYELSAQWGSQGRSPGSFSKPADVAVCGSGFVYVAEVGNNRIQKFTLDGEFVASWGKIGAREGEFSLPRGIAVDGEGNVYVSDWGNSRVQKFSSQGDFIEIFCGKGTATSDYVNFPLGIAVDGMGNVYVASSDDRRVRKFDRTGNFVLEFFHLGFNPWDVSIGPQGDVYVLCNSQRVWKFSSDGKFMKWWGRGEEIATGEQRTGIFGKDESFTYEKQRGYWSTSGTLPGEFQHSRGIAVSPLGGVFVSDTRNKRVQEFSGGGVFLLTLQNTEPFAFPYGLDTDKDGNVYIADYYGHTVRKFSPVAK